MLNKTFEKYRITNNSIKKICNSIAKKIIPTLTLLYFLSINISYADNIQSTKMFTGTVKLLNDATTALLIIAPIVAGLLGAGFGLMYSGSDEQDKKIWSKRLKVLGVGFVITISSTALVNVITAYYK